MDELHQETAAPGESSGCDPVPSTSATPGADTAPDRPAITVGDDEERRLDPRWIQAERLSGGITVSIFGGGLLLGLTIATLAGAFRWPVAALVPLGALAVCIVLAGLALGMPPVRYRHIAYRVSDERVQIRRGVMFRSVISVPRSRVQHTDVSQGPIERMWELSTLIIYTAGTQHASVHLPGLDRPTALAIRDHLLDVGEDDAV